jgi:cytosylglucuronate decarboxylase
MKPEYLFIRILEACNADCYMCGFRLSKDRYRFAASDLERLLEAVSGEGIRYIRLTGGEPTVHREIVELIRIIRAHGLESSIITNGGAPATKLHSLIAAGLSQLIVSIDGATAAMHDSIRGWQGLFDRAFQSLEEATAAGIATRVNTVCGPNNFRQMPRLQDQLTAAKVGQWELSSLKLERPLDYTDEDKAAVDEVVEYLYREGRRSGRLIPMGKIWCGETPTERERYFTTGITPRADGRCMLVHKVRYLDARNLRLYCCSLIPHRPAALDYAAPVSGNFAEFSTMSPSIISQMHYFEQFGPDGCTGCSTTAAGLSNLLRTGEPLSPWSF